MANKKLCQMEARDIAGVETEMVDWSHYSDPEGNNVAHGDLSVLRMVQRGARTPWHTTASGEDEFGLAQPPKGIA